jgi:hypothetical protein
MNKLSEAQVRALRAFAGLRFQNWTLGRLLATSPTLNSLVRRSLLEWRSERLNARRLDCYRITAAGRRALAEHDGGGK